MITAITGANGFIGNHVLAALESHGVEVRPLVRATNAVAVRSSLGGFVTVDYDNLASVMQAINDADTVVHTLGQAHDPSATEQLYARVNVTYTRDVMRACAEGNVRRVVFMSSVKVLGDGRERPYSDTSNALPKDAYGASKLRAEQLVCEMAGRAGIDFVILRPPLVYGAGVKGNLRRLISSIDRGRFIPIPRSVDTSRSLISARNLASAVVETVSWPGRIGDRFLVADGTDVTLLQLVDAIGRVMGRHPRTIPVSPGALRGISTLLRQRSVADRLLGTLRIDASRFENRFNWSAPQSLQDGMSEAVERYRAERTTPPH